MLSALSLARRIEAGELTPHAIVDLCAQAIEAREREISAFTVLDVDGARSAADALAGLPLRGLPVGMKDIFDTADFPTEYGSAIYKGHRPKADAALVMAVIVIFDETKPLSLYGYMDIEYLRPVFRAGRVPYIETLIFLLISGGFWLTSFFAFRKRTV